jgi:hypothetical protein
MSYDFKVCGREFFKLLFRVSMLKFEKVCGREFYELLRVSAFKFEVCAREVFQVPKSFKFQVSQREFFANVISFKSNFKFVQENFQVFEGFL